MTLKQRIFRRRRLVASLAAAIGLAFGGVAIANSGPSSSASTATTTKVIPFHRGQPSPAKVVGQVPPGWTAGSGTIVTGTVANKAKAAALAAYPGGTINRVVQVSGSDYNVHIIGVNWPHHVFVTQNFKVIGAE
jgi:hypothetical protein